MRYLSRVSVFASVDVGWHAPSWEKQSMEGKQWTVDRVSNKSFFGHLKKVHLRKNQPVKVYTMFKIFLLLYFTTRKLFWWEAEVI